MKKMFLLVVLSSWFTLLGQTATEPSFGDGSSGNPYQISSLEHLYWIASNSANWNKYYIQTEYIYALATSTWDNNNGWTPIGNSTTKFTGSYDGQGYLIEDLYISRSLTDNVGLFGYTNGATITNLGVRDVNIIGKNLVGGLIGRTSGCTVSKCFSTGSVSGGSYVGGLVGFHSLVTVSNCYSTVNASGGWAVGGLIGYIAGGTLSNCYSAGSVNSTDLGGGLAAVNNGTVNNCFWDMQTSGQATSAGGTGKTTTEMKTQSTFTNAGWDTAVWNLGDGINNGYPYLDWQNTSGTPLPVELTSFSASVVNGNTVLNWSTATEVNNYGFNIERRMLSEEWEKIGFVQGHGNNNSQKSYCFVDENPFGGTTFKYRIKQIDFDGTFEYSDEIEINLSIPQTIELAQNYPNPFNPSTTIKFSLPHEAKVSIKVYDIIGREVVELINGKMPPGNHIVYWHGKDKCGMKVSSGIYVYRLITENNSSLTRKMILMK